MSLTPKEPRSVNAVTATIRHTERIRHASVRLGPGNVTEVTDVTPHPDRRSSDPTSATHSDQIEGAVQLVPRPRILTIPEAAATLRIGRSSVYELIATGRLRSLKIGSRRLITLEDLDAFIDAQRERTQ